MPISQALLKLPNAILRFISALLDVDVATWSGKLFRRLAQRLLQRPEGMYEVLDYEAALELQGADGHRSVLTKRQQVRFRQDNIIAYQDQAWGDGNIFAAYRCAPGVAVDRYREGHRYRILISLRETKQRGDVQDFFIERTITDGFTQSVEEFQIEIDHVTRRLQMMLIFPAQRLPKSVKLIEQNANRTILLDVAHQQTLPDGRLQVRWENQRVRLHEDYILRWEW
jgi:hypothetical protein